VYDWEEFRQGLIHEIASDDSLMQHAHYYEQWLEAFERLLVAKGVVRPAEIAARAAEFESGQRDEVF